MSASAPEERIPSRLSAALWRGRVLRRQTLRALSDLRERAPQHRPEADGEFPIVLAEERSPLWSAETAAERRLQLGKVQNLRCAARSLDGVTVPAGEVFSFWRQVGRTTARRGYADGRELREGCVIPSRGGGLCQLSNALYGAALTVGAEICERHAHSRIVPGSAAAIGRDATVFWNYLDLRFRFEQAVRIEVRLTADELIVRFRAAAERPTPKDGGVSPGKTAAAAPLRIPLLDPIAHGCVTCGQSGCFRHEGHAARRARAETRDVAAFLLDERRPEMEAWLRAERKDGDRIAVPLDGRRWRTPRYAWDTSGFARVDTTTAEALARAIDARRLRGAPPAVQRAAQFQSAERLARAFAAAALTPDVTHLFVAQSLLPYLWRDGFLGGRTFDVLMTGLPLRALHRRLDDVLAAYPERTLLGDFRAPEAAVQAEAEALAAAERIVTPHAEIAALFPDRAVLLPWSLPEAGPRPAAASVLPRRIAFPGPTAARKGAYEVRAAARALGLEVVPLGAELEGLDFWAGVATVLPDRAGAWWETVACVVQPALVEEQPRALLRAVARGVPVVATEACGLGERYPGVATVPALDEDALIEALRPFAGGGASHFSQGRSSDASQRKTAKPMTS